MTVGERIRAIRESKQLTQSELAQLMGYSDKSAVCKAETYGNNITTKKIEKFADALDVSISYLMGWEDEDRKYDYVDTDLIASIITSKSDMEFVKTYGKLNPENKSKVNDIAQALLFTQENH